MMLDSAHKDEQWISLENASKLTGKSTGALRLAIQRKKIVRTKKIKENGREYWVIHRDELDYMCAHVRGELCDVQNERTIDAQVCAVPFETYDQHRREWEDRCAHLEQGLMMYRYKFEEVERQLKILPAPPEVISTQLQEIEHDRQQKTAALTQAEKILEEAKETQKQYAEAMEQLKAKLLEEEHAREAYRIQWEAARAELSRPWWQKLWRKR